MEDQDHTTPAPLTDLLQATRRLLAECQKLLDIMAERERRERGEDGFDG
jgi:hypothetical protein